MTPTVYLFIALTVAGIYAILLSAKRYERRNERHKERQELRSAVLQHEHRQEQGG